MDALISRLYRTIFIQYATSNIEKKVTRREVSFVIWNNLPVAPDPRLFVTS